MLDLVGYALGICVIALFLMGTAIAGKACWIALKANWTDTKGRY